MSGPGEQPIHVGALGATGEYRARRRVSVPDVAGAGVAELSLVPPLYADRAMSALRRADGWPVDEAIARIQRAARLFATATIGGLRVEQYEHVVSRVAGLPLPVVRATTAALASRLGLVSLGVQHARPSGAVGGWRDPLTRKGGAVWARRGDVFALHAAGNHPGTHGVWPEALALGYRVAVRPSRREPFTPYRLVAALRAAGFRDDQVMLLPTDHEAAGSILNGADLAMVYGGQDVVDRYAGDGRILLQGPGRSKILLTADVDWRPHLDTIVDSVSRHGGTGCVNTTAVLIEGDPAPLCQALAERLTTLPSLPPEDEKAVLPVQRLATAQALAAHLERVAHGTRPWLPASGVVADLGDGSAVLRPAVHEVDRPDAGQLRVELPFPCVWVAPWNPRQGLAPLRQTLVLTAITGDGTLVDRLLDEPTIRNLYLGDQPTYRMEPGLPHDGFLAEFLMRSKAVIRD